MSTELDQLRDQVARKAFRLVAFYGACLALLGLATVLVAGVGAAIGLGCAVYPAYLLGQQKERLRVINHKRRRLADRLSEHGV